MECWYCYHHNDKGSHCMNCGRLLSRPFGEPVRVHNPHNALLKELDSKETWMKLCAVLLNELNNRTDACYPDAEKSPTKTIAEFGIGGPEFKRLEQLCPGDIPTIVAMVRGQGTDEKLMLILMANKDAISLADRLGYS